MRWASSFPAFRRNLTIILIWKQYQSPVRMYQNTLFLTVYSYGSFKTLHSFLSVIFHDGSNIFLLDLFYAQYAERNILMRLTCIREVGKLHTDKISQSTFLMNFFSHFFFTANYGCSNNYV